MSRDNVTPFRRPPKRPVQRQSGGGGAFKTHRGKAVLVHLLVLATYALAYFFPFPPPPGASFLFVVSSCISLATALGAAALAMQNRYDAMPWAATHHEHAVRTLIIGFVIWTLTSAVVLISPSFAIVTYVGHLGVLIWAGVRSLVGLVLALLRRPIWRPRGWLF